ncbi:putative hydroxyindole O-methyltransferase [Nemania diffusa]|nr:putative hydroxyindole O-methyltransferase [Nemania diffusa]
MPTACSMIVAGRSRLNFYQLANATVEQREGDILAQLQAAGVSYAAKTAGAREKLMSLSRDLISNLELPSESLMRIGWAALDIFNHSKQNSSIGIITKVLAEKCNANETLVSRVMRHLVAMNVVGENGEDTYYSNPLAEAFAEAGYRDGIIFNSPIVSPFNSCMSTYRAGKPLWLDPGFYPVTKRLIAGLNSDHSDIFLVDVGGDLQDQPSVISTVASDLFEAMPHDFFTSQPVKHARAYYLHSVLHNWSDDDCIRILRQLRPTMKLGYSRLLINDIVMPRQNPTWPATSMDNLMLVLNAVQEQTEEDLNKLLKQTGFNLVKVYSYELG